MPGLTAARINADIDAIQADLSLSGATESVTVKSADQTANRIIGLTIIRGKSLSAEELRDTGFAKNYSESIYVQKADAPTGAYAIILEDVFILSDLTARVLDIGKGPTQNLLRYDLGDEFQDGG